MITRVLFAVVFFGLALPSEASADNCIFEGRKPEPRYVLGSLVEPQADIVIVGDCQSNFEELHEEYVRRAPNRRAPILGDNDFMVTSGCAAALYAEGSAALYASQCNTTMRSGGQ